MKKMFFLPLIIIIVSGFYSGGQKDKNPEITASEIQDHINYLASDKLQGRYTGSKGGEMAAEYIEADFKSTGLKPLFNESFRQNFPFVAGIKLSGHNRLLFNINGKEINPKINDEYTPAPFSGNVDYHGLVVFAGYGISVPDLNYDDYKNLDVRGKAVLIMRYNPEGANPHSEFGKYSAYRYKANTAKEKGASAVIFVSGYIPKNDEDKLMKLNYDGAGPMPDIGIIQIKREFADKLFKAEGLNFKSVQERIDSLKSPDSFTFNNSKVVISTGVEEIMKTADNVGGYLAGNDPELKNEYIVIGAHYDHLGWGETGSLYRGSVPQIHNGADDNASGTTGVMELAEKFASQKENLKRSMIFVCFSGEELGLLGSSYFINNSPVSINKIDAMVNLDMVGRLNPENQLTIYGTGTSSGFKDLLNNDNKNFNFKLTFIDDGYGPSDQSSFYSKDIPVLFFFTGTHTDYHRPTDDADKINSKGEEEVLRYVYDISDNLDESSSKPDYINVPRKSEGRPMAFSVYVGTVPDYATQVDGLKINGVGEGSPAQKAGLQGGDIIVKFGDKKISNIYDYTYALGDYSPGDIVAIVVMRNGEKKTFKVELGAR
jgi:aminopeptidase YwaD